MLFNKKGQEGFSGLGTLGALIILAVVLGLVIFFFVRASNAGGDVVGLVPEVENLATTVCGGYVNVGDAGALRSYCVDFKNFKGFEDGNHYISCDWNEIEVFLKAKNVVPLDCVGDVAEIVQKNKMALCEEVKAESESKYAKTKINGVSCSIILAEVIEVIPDEGEEGLTCDKYISVTGESKDIFSEGSGVLSTSSCSYGSFKLDGPGDEPLQKGIVNFTDVSSEVVGLQDGEICCLAVFVDKS